MADDTKADNNKPETDTQEAPMPSVEQKQADTSAVEGAAQETVETPQPAESEGLPESASDRTRSEFDKLRQQLREERNRRETVESAFQAMQQPEQTQAKQPEPEPLYDPVTGLLNEQAIVKSQQQALQAQQQADAMQKQWADYQARQDEQALYDAYPTLNSNSDDFDKEFFNEARRYYYDSNINPDSYDGRQLTWKQAADLVKSKANKSEDAAKKQGAQEAVEKLTPKEQASLSATGVPSERATSNEKMDDLQRKSRKGDLDSIVERLRTTVKE